MGAITDDPDARRAVSGRMKTKLRYLVLLLALGLQYLVTSGCANTAKGVSQDYHRAEDKVENALK
jgi:predicted small secreted protein